MKKTNNKRSFHIKAPKGKCEIGGDHVFIVAELGKNFIQTQEDRPLDEYLKNAIALIDAAADAGVDAVKFQTHVLADEQLNLKIVEPHFSGSDRYSWIGRNERATPLSFLKALKKHAEKRGLVFFSTPMSTMGAKKLAKVGVPMWKVASQDTLDFKMLDYMQGTGLPMIISSGRVGFSELDLAVNRLKEKNVPLAILYCISKYPCPADYYNLGTIEHLIERYPDTVIGFSDHCIDTNEPALAAVKLGAKIIEKHFSLSRDFWGADHRASLIPDEMAALVKAVRNGEHHAVDHLKYYGEKRKELPGATSEFRPFTGKKFVAARDIKKGESITRSMVHTMRPAKLIDGVPSHEIHKVIGKKTKRAFKKYDPIHESHLS